MAWSTTRFWWKLGSNFAKLHDVTHSRGIAAQLKPSVEQVFTAFIRHLRFPEDFKSLLPEKQEDFRHGFRYDVSDMLTKVGGILGAESVTALVGSYIHTAMKAWAESGDGMCCCCHTLTCIVLTAIAHSPCHCVLEANRVLSPIGWSRVAVIRHCSWRESVSLQTTDFNIVSVLGFCVQQVKDGSR